ncbi:MAG: spheroidene monooxygenase [Rhodobacteraceae bacterium]|nr:spheroidene monooxygenase [Paracoccaceae bacterium]
MQTITLCLFRFDRTAARLWVLGQMVAARVALARQPGLEFCKICGSGTGQGFTPRPNWGVWAILGVWGTHAAAQQGVASGAFARWDQRADESYTLFLEPYSARGRWSGRAPFRPEGVADGPVAAMTRASVRPARALRFWGQVPDISARVGADPNVMFKIGIGEMPLLRQVTFSVWPDAGTMAEFARRGPHQQAIRAVREERWFSEELYARFRISARKGTWQGRDPLDPAAFTQEAA